MKFDTFTACLKKASAWMSNAEEDLGVAYAMFNEERYA